MKRVLHIAETAGTPEALCLEQRDSEHPHRHQNDDDGPNRVEGGPHLVVLRGGVGEGVG